MTTSPVRQDASNLRRLEEMRATYERLRADRIRAESEVERLTAELGRARESARAAFGTDDEGAIAAMIEAAQARNTALVEEFAGLLRTIETRLKSLGDGR
jgi:hypothetical protein